MHLISRPINEIELLKIKIMIGELEIYSSFSQNFTFFNITRLDNKQVEFSVITLVMD